MAIGQPAHAVAGGVDDVAAYSAPAGERSANKRIAAESILPGGRIITPEGRQFSTGVAPFGIAVSPNGTWVATADSGRNRPSVTVLQEAGSSMRRNRYDAPLAERTKEDGAGRSGSQLKARAEGAWGGAYVGIAFDGNSRLFVSEGNTGRVRLIDARSGNEVRTYDLNQHGFRQSISAGLAVDAKRRRLYVVDQANFRLVMLDTRNGKVRHSVPVGSMPLHVALSPDLRFAYVTNQGMDPAPESNSVTVIDLGDAQEMRRVTDIPTGQAVSKTILGASHPAGVLATAQHLFVSNGHNDSVSVIDRENHKLIGEIPLRIPGLETLRGVLPTGLAFDAKSGLLYVAEAGINAVGVIDAQRREVLGHLPTGWFPVALAVQNGRLFVANAKGHGSGPNAGKEDPFPKELSTENLNGTVSVMPVPSREALAASTQRVLANNGFQRSTAGSAALPSSLKHVVFITKGSAAFDDVYGDITRASNGAVNGAASLARHGNVGYAASGRSGLTIRGEVRDTAITPNQHALAARYAFSDNFYLHAEQRSLGKRWALGLYPNSLSELVLPLASATPGTKVGPAITPPGRIWLAAADALRQEDLQEAGSLWHHLARHGVSYRNFSAAAATPDQEDESHAGTRWSDSPRVSDQARATHFIAELDKAYVKGSEALPQFLFLSLPIDHNERPDPEAGHPFRASYVADNDVALGRIVEYLSHSPWWKDMAIFVMETGTEGSADHIDSHRSGLLVVSPYSRRNYVSHRNTGTPSVLKTAFQILGVPPMNLYDATATDLSDCFQADLELTPHEALRVNKRLFDAEATQGSGQ